MADVPVLPTAEGAPGETGNLGEKSHRLLPGLPDGDDGGYRTGPVLSEPVPMIQPETGGRRCRLFVLPGGDSPWP